MRSILLFLLTFSFLFISCTNKQQVCVKSPDGEVSVKFLLTNGTPCYLVSFHSKSVIDTSMLGLILHSEPAISKDLEITGVLTSSKDETWKPLYGQFYSIRNHFNESTIKLKEHSGLKRQINITFRVYNDGIGFRYEVPKQPQLSNFEITGELTSFRFPANNDAWWIQLHYDSYEILYNHTPISKIPGTILNHRTKSEGILYMKNAAENIPAVHTPLTMFTPDSLYVSIHEAALKDYSEMSLKIDDSTKYEFKVHLAPRKNGLVNLETTPFTSPWRTIQIGCRPGDLVESSLIANLNDPCHDTTQLSWIKPIKFAGIWWGYHIGKYTWSYPGTKEKPHGANTANAKAHIDFCARNGIKGLLVEGWNVYPGGKPVSYTHSAPDYDLIEVARYAKEKGVELIAHNETMGAFKNYENQLDSTFSLYEKLGIHYIKTGYAWYCDSPEYHSSQGMIKHYQTVIKKAFAHKIMIDAHEPVKGTGEWRTWPNMMTREGERGNEYNAWDTGDGNPPEHQTILPFTWLLSGPMDYTPGIFDIEFDAYKKKQRVHNTLANQLALYVIIYSPIQMVADLPENYEKHPDAFTFIKEVPVSWDTTVVCDAAIGDYVVIARRSGNDWYIGGITDENPRTLITKLTFLPKGRNYKATVYSDAPETNFWKNPTAYSIINEQLNSKMELSIKVNTGGGFAARLTPVN
jgi:glucan 1,4-alpha-glucosidase